MVQKLRQVTECIKQGRDPLRNPYYGMGELVNTDTGFVGMEVAGVHVYCC